MSVPFLDRDVHQEEPRWEPESLSKPWESPNGPPFTEVPGVATHPGFPPPTVAVGTTSGSVPLPTAASEAPTDWSDSQSPTTLATSTTTNAPSTSGLGYTPASTLSSELPSPTQYESDPGNSDPSNSAPAPGPVRHSLAPIAIGVAVPVIIVVIAVAVFFFLRKRKKQATVQAQMEQMKGQPFMAAPYGSSPVPPSPGFQQQYTIPSPQSRAPVAAQPVILGPITHGSNGGYLTGMDTSDVVSVHERSGLGNPFANGGSLGEEPPPPYRPRSIAPPSRDSSVLAPPTVADSQTSLIGNRPGDARSPFEDSVDDDAVSEMSGHTLRAGHETMSTVSDLSYQDDPVVHRPAS